MGAKILRALVVAAVIATSTSIAVGWYLRSQQECIPVTFVAEGTPTEDQIRETVRVLTRRVDELGEEAGVVRASLRADEEGKIEGTLWVDRDVGGFLQRLVAAGEMELRFVAPRKGRVELGDEYEKVPWRQTYYSLEEPGESYEKVEHLSVKKVPELRVRSFKSVKYHTERLATKPVITLQLHPDDAQAFNRIRRQNHGRELAVVIDGEVLFSAVIADSVETDRVQIRGIRGTSEAKRVARTLQIGALPLKLRIEDTQSVQ